MRNIVVLLLFVSVCGCENKEIIETAADSMTVADSCFVVGLWTDPTPAEEGKIIIYTTDGTLFVMRTIPQGGKGFNEAEVKMVSMDNDVARVNYVKDVHGEYFILEEDGSLGFYNEAGTRFASGKLMDYSLVKGGFQ